MAEATPAPQGPVVPSTLDPRTKRFKPMCSSSRCYCGNSNSRAQCEWWKARNIRHDDTADPAVIAQQLWQESRELLAKMNVELSTSPPRPPRRWYRLVT